jgi:hypothetical protein
MQGLGSIKATAYLSIDAMLTQEGPTHAFLVLHVASPGRQADQHLGNIFDTVVHQVWGFQPGSLCV